MITAQMLMTESINSYKWDFFDFKDINESLARKLSDEDIGGILVCIDAVHTIKVFKLTKGLFNIVGHGLEPLRGSRIIERIDMSPVDALDLDECGEYSFLSLLSEETVVPILDSIITVEGSSLKQLNLPKKWRVNKVPILTRFLTRYNRALNRRELACSRNDCTSTCRHNEFPWIGLQSWVFGHDGMYGVQQHTCYDCNDHFCEVHTDEMTPFICEICELTHCMDCNPTKECELCNVASCQECEPVYMCEGCDRSLCGNCCSSSYCENCGDLSCEDCTSLMFCEYDGCDRMNCDECTPDENINELRREQWPETWWQRNDAVQKCLECNVRFCGEHLVLDLHSSGEWWRRSCEDCYDRAFLELKRTNRSILKSLHEWEAKYGYQTRFEINLKSDDLDELFTKQLTLKQRWDQLFNMSTFEEREEKLLQDITYFFTVI
jgi:hypothetical protein